MEFNKSHNPLVQIRTIDDAINALLQGYSVTCSKQAVTMEMLQSAKDNNIPLTDILRIMEANESQ
jgi:hypothetical protein